MGGHTWSVSCNDRLRDAVLTPYGGAPMKSFSFTIEPAGKIKTNWAGSFAKWYFKVES